MPTTKHLDKVASRLEATLGSTFAVAVQQPSTGLLWMCGHTEQPYFVASITKLFTATLIMQLREEQAIVLDARAADVLGAETMSGLNVIDGFDYGPAITIRQLLSHTSGVPDYFEQRQPDGTTFSDNMRRVDRHWSFEELVGMARQMDGKFAPSSPGRAYYSDTNYQLLGRIIEAVTSRTYGEELARRIIAPLGLRGTWLFNQQTHQRYDDVLPVRHGTATLRIPRTLGSFNSDGGLVSTLRDQLLFIRAFIEGALFPLEYLTEMTDKWNSVFSRFDPIEYGMGMMRFKLPRWMSPFSRSPTMIGHSGSFGSVLYHVPERDLYVAGSLNQMVPRSLPYRLLLQLVRH